MLVACAEPFSGMGGCDHDIDLSRESNGAHAPRLSPALQRYGQRSPTKPLVIIRIRCPS